MWKNVLFCVNFLCLVIGFTTFFIGLRIEIDWHRAMVLVRKNNITVDSKSNALVKEISEQSVIQVSSVLLIVIGTFVMLGVFLGCYGNINEYRGILVLYGILFTILSVVQMIACISMMEKSPNTSSIFELEKSLKRSLRHYRHENTNISKLWDLAMRKKQCCGVEGYQDFVDAKVFDNNFVPIACCKIIQVKKIENNETVIVEKTEPCSKNATSLNSNIDNGCFPILADWMKNHTNAAIGLFISSSALLILAVALSVMTCRNISKSQTSTSDSSQLRKKYLKI